MMETLISETALLFGNLDYTSHFCIYSKPTKHLSCMLSS